MPESPGFDHVDLTGARFHKVQLTGATFRMVDLSGAVLRDLSLVDVSIDGAELTGLTIDGVEIAPLVEAELTRRDPARAMRHASDPAALRAAWAAVGAAWAPLYERAGLLPADGVERSVLGEWSFAQTLRHLAFVTDAWLGAVEARRNPFHAWGIPFTELTEFIHEPLDDIGIDIDARPSYDDVLALRTEQVARMRDLLEHVTVDDLEREVAGPVWDREPISVVRCLRVIVNEELEHLRFARRDLAVVEDQLTEQG